MVLYPRRDDLDILEAFPLPGLHLSSYVKNQRGVHRSHERAGYVLWGRA